MRRTFGDSIYLRLYPDWESDQADTVRMSCTSDTKDVLVAVADGRPIGFVAVAFDAYWEGIGEVSIIAVDPDHQRRGLGRRLITVALDHMRARGMDSAVVETGNDPGHAPARALYASTGFTLLPVGRYFQLLDEPQMAGQSTRRQT
jgi:GNAT superfamily N-acetyltransferase